MWFTADLHFGHYNVIPYCGRPFKDADKMDRELIEKYNALVTDTDTVFILGDFTLFATTKRPRVEKYIRQLNGRKHLVLGNHDRFKPFTYVDMGFETVHTAVQVEEFVLMHDPAGSECVRDAKVLCGHVHTLFLQQRNCLNVGVDVWDYQPVHIETIREVFK